MKFVLTLANAGTAHFRPKKSKITVKNSQGQEVAKMDIPDAPVLPGATRDVEITPELKLPPGQYLAEAVVDTGQRDLLARQLVYDGKVTLSLRNCSAIFWAEWIVLFWQHRCRLHIFSYSYYRPVTEKALIFRSRPAGIFLTSFIHGAELLEGEKCAPLSGQTQTSILPNSTRPGAVLPRAGSHGEGLSGFCHGVRFLSCPGPLLALDEGGFKPGIAYYYSRFQTFGTSFTISELFPFVDFYQNLTNYGLIEGRLGYAGVRDTYEHQPIQHLGGLAKLPDRPGPGRLLGRGSIYPHYPFSRFF